jgi:hypothetical protein
LEDALLALIRDPRCYGVGRKRHVNDRIMAFRPGRRFRFASQRSWVWQRSPRLTISGALATAQFLKLDHHSLALS